MGCQRVKCRQVVFAIVGPTKGLSYERKLIYEKKDYMGKMLNMEEGQLECTEICHFFFPPSFGYNTSNLHSW